MVQKRALNGRLRPGLRRNKWSPLGAGPSLGNARGFGVVQEIPELAGRLARLLNSKSYEG